MREDEARIRKDHAAENMAVIRYIAVNLLKQEKTQKVGVHAKQLIDACDNAYISTVLHVCGNNA